jgi:gluconate 2-dehydrogenase gamma chain
MTNLTRRKLLKVTAVAGAAMLPAAAPAEAASAHEPAPGTAAHAPTAGGSPKPKSDTTTYVFLNTAEAEFIEAAVARLIPADDQWPGALEAGVANYIDKQLAGAWGAGERLYRSGPWRPGTPSQGYQLPYTPAELFRTALAGIRKELQRPFAKMSAGEQDAYLKRLQAGGRDLGGVPSEVFFAHLWQCTIEGFFSDPVYGGNRDMVSWRMIGFPGAYASYYDLVDKHGIKIVRAPMSLAEDAHSHVHVDPNIPARSP